jgi:uncharacterized RDD family membrane protein YckC
LKLKYLIGLLLTVITYYVLTLIYKPLILSICVNNDSRLTNFSVFTPDIQTLIFCLLIFSLFVIIAHTKNNFISYFQTIGLLIVLICIALILQMQMINYVTKSKPESSIINQVDVDYRLFYFLPTIFLIPPFLKQFISLIDGKSIAHKFEILSHKELDKRTLRFVSKLIDIAIVISIAFIFSKIIVIYPDFPMMTFIGLYFYLFISEYSIETTIGKLIFGLKVISTKTKNISGFKIFVRTIVRLVPFYSLGILFNKDGLHDYISGTKVVKTNKENGIS